MATTDASGNVVGEMRYYASGETRLDTGNMFTDRLFTGQRQIAELGIYQFGARFYSPKMGRFLSADPMAPNIASPQGFNRYSYALNNPIRYNDPTGYWIDEGCGMGGGGGGTGCNLPTSGGGGGGGGGGETTTSTPTSTSTPTVTPTLCPQVAIACIPTATITPTPYYGPWIGATTPTPPPR